MSARRSRFGAWCACALLLLCSLRTLAADGASPTYATADDAVAGLIDAIRKGNREALVRVIGPGSERWIFSGDPVADKAGFAKFIAAYEQKHALEAEGADRTVLVVGNDNWPFPVPLVKSGDRWRFDAAAGQREILARRVGRNELDTIQTMRAIVDAQREYARLDRDRDGLLEYAQKFRSSAGKHDGLYWPVRPGESESPLGSLMASAQAEGYGRGGEGKPQPYHGYVYRMLTGQGASAPGGAYDYMVRGSMIGGFAVVAWPVNYGNSGVMTFIVNHDGVVYQKDLGPGTKRIAGKMTRFDPGEGWSKVQ